jgi:hypothetical protein
LLIFATAFPYRLEEAYMNPLEWIVHGIGAPGRHLSTPVEIRGAVCESPWKAGHRIPMSVGKSHYLLCRRHGLAEVRIRVQSKWGECEQLVPEDDQTPRCRPWFDHPSRGLQFLSQAVCTESEYERLPNGQWRVRE